MRRRKWIWIVLGVAITLSGCQQADQKESTYEIESLSDVSEEQLVEKDEDLRRYMHGINAIKRKDGVYDLVWSADEDGEKEDDSWNHDVYIAQIDTDSPKIRNTENLLVQPEAQEPVSASRTADGHTIVTFEDGNDTEREVAQRYVVYNDDWQVVKDYPQTVADGGHSGHVASTSNHHIVFWSDDWVDGGGVNDLGSGKDVLATTFSSEGDILHTKKLTNGKDTRDWWPMLSASDDTVLLVWQRYVEDETYAQLMYAVYNPKDNEFIVQPRKLREDVKYYTYEVSYVESLNRFVVSGTDNHDEGFLYVMDKDGKMITSKEHVRAFVREAKPAIQGRKDDATLIYPTAPSGFAVYRISKNSLEQVAAIEDDYEWQYGGTVGFFTDEGDAYFASLSKKGIVEKRIFEK